MNLCWRPGVSIINTSSMLCYLKMCFKTFRISRNMYFFNYLCYTCSHGRSLPDFCIALCSKSLVIWTIYAFILSKLLIALMGFPRLCSACFTRTAHECTQSKLNDMRHAWYAVFQSRPLDSGGLNGWLYRASLRVIWEGVISCISKKTAIGMLQMNKNILPRYG